MLHPRGPQQLANLAWFRAFTWANSVVPSLEIQALVPMTGQDPVELGIAGMDETVAARLEADPEYPSLFRASFPEEVQLFTYPNIAKAIAAFERTLISGNSPYDRYQRGDPTALSASARRGVDLFFSDRIGCASCHSGFAFTDAAGAPGEVGKPFPFHNIGLYDVDGRGAYPADGTGLMALTFRPEDMGRFRTPPLRNVAVTAPYMHDGSVATLSEVIDVFAAGGRARLQNGVASPLQSPLVRAFTITAGEKADLLAFLEALTDEEFLRDPRFSDPFASAVAGAAYRPRRDLGHRTPAHRPDGPVPRLGRPGHAGRPHHAAGGAVRVGHLVDLALGRDRRRLAAFTKILT